MPSVISRLCHFLFCFTFLPFFTSPVLPSLLPSLYGGQSWVISKSIFCFTFKSWLSFLEQLCFSLAFSNDFIAVKALSFYQVSDFCIWYIILQNCFKIPFSYSLVLVFLLGVVAPLDLTIVQDLPALHFPGMFPLFPEPHNIFFLHFSLILLECVSSNHVQGKGAFQLTFESWHIWKCLCIFLHFWWVIWMDTEF